jgi:hypothetical protein
MSATLRFWKSSGDGRLALASVPTISAMDMMGVVDNEGCLAGVGDFRQEHGAKAHISANHKPIFGFQRPLYVLYGIITAAVIENH